MRQIVRDRQRQLQTNKDGQSKSYGQTGLDKDRQRPRPAETDEDKYGQSKIEKEIDTSVRHRKKETVGKTTQRKTERERENVMLMVGT